MKFTSENGVWYLIDETAPADACVIAVLRDDVEVLALRQFCQEFLANGVSGQLDFEHGGQRYTVSAYPDRGSRLSLRIQGGDGSLRRVETQFTFPGPEVAG